jgi:hypothetical protein
MVAPVNREAPIRLARRRSRAAFVALAALFWLAQLQGVAHLVSHLARDHAAPHSLVCGDCIASADAGAAPLPAVVALAFAAPADGPPPRLVARTVPAAAATAYRSRAPPATPV